MEHLYICPNVCNSVDPSKLNHQDLLFWKTSNVNVATSKCQWILKRLNKDMLGSKIKSWVENHLGRPRKKSNKNKNVPPADNLTNGEQYNQKHAASGFTIYSTNSCSSPLKTVTTTNNSSLNHVGYSSGVISSPSRRREVSPIQNHVSFFK